VKQSELPKDIPTRPKTRIRRSDPVPAPPAGLKDDQFGFSLDVNFNNRSARL
jgi:hypothetical protein